MPPQLRYRVSAFRRRAIQPKPMQEPQNLHDGVDPSAIPLPHAPESRLTADVPQLQKLTIKWSYPVHTDWIFASCHYECCMRGLYGHGASRILQNRFDLYCICGQVSPGNWQNRRNSSCCSFLIVWFHMGCLSLFCSPVAVELLHSRTNGRCSLKTCILSGGGATMAEWTNTTEWEPSNHQLVVVKLAVEPDTLLHFFKAPEDCWTSRPYNSPHHVCWVFKCDNSRFWRN